MQNTSIIPKVVPASRLRLRPSFKDLPRLSPDEVAVLEASIREKGIRQPLIINSDFEVCDGRERFEIAQKNDILEVPVFVLDVADFRTFALESRIVRGRLTKSGITLMLFELHPDLAEKNPGQIGAYRSEMERETKLRTECREGRRDPRNHFLMYAQATEQIEAKMAFTNQEPMEGLNDHHVPADVYARGVAERGDELPRLSPEQVYLFSRNQRFTTRTKAHALVRYTAREGGRRGWWFHHRDLYRHEGQRLAVYLDEECPSAGAVVVPIYPGRAPEPIACELVDGCPQFALGLDMDMGKGTQAALDAVSRRDTFNDAVRSEYRSLGLADRRLGRSSSVDDGAGNRTHVEQPAFPPTRHDRGQRPTSTPGNGETPEQAESCAGREGIRKSARTAQPLSQDAGYMAGLEAKFREEYPDLAIT